MEVKDGTADAKIDQHAIYFRCAYPLARFVNTVI